MSLDTDCQPVLDFLIKHVPPPSGVAPIISDCRLLLNEFHQVRVDHVYREATGADAMAKMGGKLLCSFSLFNSCPPSLGNFLLDDLRGVCFPGTL